MSDLRALQEDIARLRERLDALQMGLTPSGGGWIKGGGDAYALAYQYDYLSADLYLTGWPGGCWMNVLAVPAPGSGLCAVWGNFGVDLSPMSGRILVDGTVRARLGWVSGFGCGFCLAPGGATIQLQLQDDGWGKKALKDECWLLAVNLALAKTPG